MSLGTAHRLRRWTPLLLALLPLAFAFAGCGTAKKVALGNLPPDTGITVTAYGNDTLNAVNHLIRLRWFGTDPDGDVVAYQMRMVNDLTAADSAWVLLDCTTSACTESLFTIYAPNGYTRATLEVRAVDNKGAVDPVPARQRFGFLNTAPVVDFLSGPGVLDSSYASVTASWSVDDRGGDLSKISFRIYLDGNEAVYDSVYSGTSTASFTVPSQRFIQGPAPGEWRSGFRKLYVRAVDDGGRIGLPDSITWYVRAPGLVTIPATQKGRALLIDNSFRTASNDQRVDTLFSRTLARNLPQGTFSVLHLDVDNPFKSARDIGQTFRQFDAVIWYRGFDTFAATTLTAYQDSVFEYIRHGGRFLIEGLNMFEGPGLVSSVPTPMLHESFITEFLDSWGQRRFYNSTLADSSVAWGNRNNNDPLPPVFRSSTMQDSMRLVSTLFAGIRVMNPKDTSEVAFWAKPNALEPVIPENLAVMMSVRQPSGGRVVVIPLPIRQADLAYSSPSRLLAKLIFHATEGLFAP